MRSGVADALGFVGVQRPLSVLSEIADTLALKDDHGVPRIDGWIWLLGRLERKCACLQRKLARRDIGGSQDELFWLHEEAGLAVEHLDYDLFTRVPLDLKWPVGPARGQVVLARDGQPLAIGFRFPEGGIPPLRIELGDLGLDIDRVPGFEQGRIKLNFGDGDLVDPGLTEFITRLERVDDGSHQRAIELGRVSIGVFPVTRVQRAWTWGWSLNVQPPMPAPPPLKIMRR